MQTAIHPEIFETKVTCACGNTFTFAGTKPELEVEVCSECHPFYTGQMKFLDAAGRVDKFKNKLKAANKNHLSKSERRALKKQKRIDEESSRPETLKDLKTSDIGKKIKKAKKKTS